MKIINKCFENVGDLKYLFIYLFCRGHPVVLQN